MKIMKICGIAGILAPIVALFAIGTSVALHNFSWTSDALSDLGALDTSYKFIYNGGLITTGALGAIFTFGMIRKFDYLISKIGAIIFLSSMISLIGVGLYPSGTDPHVTVSWLFFSLGALGMLSIGLGETYKRKPWGRITLIVTVIGLIAAFFTSSRFSGAAIPETVGAIGFSIIAIGYGFKLYRG